MHCPHVASQDGTRARQCSQLTASEFSIWCLASPCFEVFREWEKVTGCSRSSDNSAGLLPRTSGKMKTARPSEGKAGTKGCVDASVVLTRSASRVGSCSESITRERNDLRFS